MQVINLCGCGSKWKWITDPTCFLVLEGTGSSCIFEWFLVLMNTCLLTPQLLKESEFRNPTCLLLVTFANPGYLLFSVQGARASISCCISSIGFELLNFCHLVFLLVPFFFSSSTYLDALFVPFTYNVTKMVNRYSWPLYHRFFSHLYVNMDHQVRCW